MKNLLLCLFLFAGIAIGHSQIVLKESNVEYIPGTMEVDAVTNSVSLTIPEAYVNEFKEDPLSFIQDNFNINQLIRDNEQFDFDSYQVFFQSKDGNVLANFDEKGDLVSSFHRFKDVILPDDVRLEILRSYKNSKVLKNKHIVTTKDLAITKEYYIVKVLEGDRTRRLKIDRNAQGLSLAGL